MLLAANADVYFDNSLVRLGDLSTLRLGRQVLALTKWINQGTDIQLQLRTNSQDAWIFQPPVNAQVLNQTAFFLGAARCDNRLAHLLASAGHELVNPAFAIHVIETHSASRQGSLYDTKGSVFGAGRDVLLSDRHLF